MDAVLKPKIHMEENVSIIHRDKDGNIKQGWQPNEKGMEHYRKTGVLLQTPEFGHWADEVHLSNIITNVGLGLIAARIGLTSPAAATYMALGSGNTTPAAGDTALQTELTTNNLGRVSVTPTSQTTSTTNDTIQWQNTFTASGSSTVNELGILNAASGGTLVGHVLVGPYSMINGDSIQFTYKIVVARA